MTCRQGYKSDSLTADGALQELEQCSGTQFDPALVRSFKALIERREVELYHEASSPVGV